MQFFKINCMRSTGDTYNPHTHFVVATSVDDATAAVMSDAQAAGYDCKDQQVIPIQDDVMVGN